MVEPPRLESELRCYEFGEQLLLSGVAEGWSVQMLLCLDPSACLEFGFCFLFEGVMHSIAEPFTGEELLSRRYLKVPRM